MNGSTSKRALLPFLESRFLNKAISELNWIFITPLKSISEILLRIETGIGFCCFVSFVSFEVS